MDAIDKINAILAEKGMTGAELLRMIGASTGTYSQWNTRLTKPSKRSLKKIADALEIDVRAITGDDDLLPELDVPEKHPPSDTDIKAAFWGGDQDLSEQDIDELWEDARAYIQFKTEQKKKGKRKQ